jgi:small subunit ribosomal protein S14
MPLFIIIYSRQHQWKVLDNTRRRAHIKFELKSRLIKSLFSNRHLEFSQKHLASYRKSSIPRAASVTRIVNRCVYTGRKYSTLKKFQTSRFATRSNAYEGLLPGVRRHSW